MTTLYHGADQPSPMAVNSRATRRGMHFVKGQLRVDVQFVLPTDHVLVNFSINTHFSTPV
jgi:hypothetical protein